MLGSLLALLLVLGSNPASAQTWQVYPWVGLAAGHENDRLLESGTIPIVVPGGAFVDLRPGVLFTRPLGARSRLNIDAMASLERFANDDSRRLFGGAVNGEIQRRMGTIWRWRLTGGANYFADSAQDAVDRFRLGGEAGLGLIGRTGYIELIGGAQGRRFPNLTTVDASGTSGTYTELGGSAGATGAIRPLRWLELSGYGSWQSTDARDPTLDTTMLLGELGLRIFSPGPLQVFASAVWQQREYTAGDPGMDTDNYRQVGAGLAYALGEHVDLTARYAAARYEDPFGETDDIRRFSVSVIWWPSGHGVRAVTDPALRQLIDQENAAITYAGEPHVFRVRASGAQHVAVVGDFNGWDPLADPMTEAGDGWWERAVALPAGTHQYAYWVDGALITPPESQVTVDDGFGGRNGLLTVETADL